MGFLVGSGLTVVHFLLSRELTSTTLVSLAHLRQRERVGLLVPDINPAPIPTAENPSYVCLALAEQYFLFLSASLC